MFDVSFYHYIRFYQVLFYYEKTHNVNKNFFFAYLFYDVIIMTIYFCEYYYSVRETKFVIQIAHRNEIQA